ncbi:MAG: non-homologous end-joining DNA ligase [Saprospiraceae bacterium]|nr:non-homologous end-joining DNA ligase [Saprospiraceae bacterium]
MPKKEIITEIEGRKLKLSNLNKIIFPEENIIKAEIIQYYMTIAQFVLPFLKDRPLTLIRYPDGIHAHRFYSKNKPNWTPRWIEHTNFQDDDNSYLMANNKASLIWIANLTALELHTVQCKGKNQIQPDHFILDLDPPEEDQFDVVRKLAFKLKHYLESLHYTPFIKTSGGKGLHIYVPITPIYSQKEVIKCVKLLAKNYIKQDTNTTLKLNKEKRSGKVLLDIYRNHATQTCVVPYSIRGKNGAPISAPITWEELKTIPSSKAYSIRTIHDKIKREGDPWSDFRDHATILHTDTIHNSKKSQKHTNKIKLEGKKCPLESISLSPMLAQLGSSIPPSDEYFFEIKWDGIRVLIIKNLKEVKIISRNGNNITSKFPSLAAHFEKHSTHQYIVDGELIVNDADGKPDFSKVVSRLHLEDGKAHLAAKSSKGALVYLFDLLFMDGIDLRSNSIDHRRALLKELLDWNDKIKFSEAFKNGQDLFDAVSAEKMEGILCKKRNSPYESGHRSMFWLKIKVQNFDKALIIGYTKGKGERSNFFGALHLAKKKNDKYVYFGKIGTGFNQEKIANIMEKMSNVPKTSKPIKEQIEDEKNTIWIQPLYACELKYASMTNNNTYREPVFIRMFSSSELRNN